MTDYKATWRKRTYSYAYNYLGAKCAKCGTTQELQFDHRDPGTKVAEISAIVRDGWGRDRLTDELDKCQLLCIKHHQAKTRECHEHRGGHNRIVSPRHGTAVMYGLKKCRCLACRDWKRAYRNREVDSLGHPLHAPIG